MQKLELIQTEKIPKEAFPALSSVYAHILKN